MANPEPTPKPEDEDDRPVDAEDSDGLFGEKGATIDEAAPEDTQNFA